jgi:hypothetical protein
MAKDKANGMHRDEVFVDIVERISVTFNSSGYMLTSEVNGAIMVRTPTHHPLVEWATPLLWPQPSDSQLSHRW